MLTLHTEPAHKLLLKAVGHLHNTSELIQKMLSGPLVAYQTVNRSRVVWFPQTDKNNQG